MLPILSDEFYGMLVSSTNKKTATDRENARVREVKKRKRRPLTILNREREQKYQNL